MNIELTIHFPALDHFAQVLEGRDLAALVDNFHRELNERLEALQPKAEAAKAPVEPEPMEPKKPEPVEPEPKEPEPVPDPVEPEPVPAFEAVGMSEIRRACAALRDAGKLQDLQQLLKGHGAKNLSALKPDQLASFVEGLRELGAKL